LSAVKNIRLLLTGGGTGGHLFPAVAAAQEFCRRYPGTEVLFVGTKRKVDTKSLAQYGFAGKSITCHGLKGKNIVQLLKALATLPIAYYQAWRIIQDFKPDIILGVGGYVTGPVIAAGWRSRIPTLIHEQNSVPGLANRKLGNLVDRVCLSLPGSGEEFAKEKVVYTGNPVRSNILDLLNDNESKNNGERTCLTVLGGSQGAHAINLLVPDALAAFSTDELATLGVIHQTGAKDAESVRDKYRKLGVSATVEPFFDDMEEVYGKTDILVSRAGATTLSEAAVLGIPTILIPYPSAADNHQEKNGKYYVDGGGVTMFVEKDLTSKRLGEEISKLLGDEVLRAEMGASMKRMSFPDAAERIVSCCKDLMKKQK